MPLLPSSFLPPRLLRSPHTQTITPALFRKPRIPDAPLQLLPTSDGDVLTYRVYRGKADRLAIISHGLEGSVDSSYVKGMTGALLAAGWDVLTWNMRGCGGAPNHLITWYHSGKSDDLAAIVAHAVTLPYRGISLIGFSIGGNITLKYLGEEGRALHRRISQAIAISVPMDLRGSAERLAERSALLYMNYLLRPLRHRIRQKKELFPEHFTTTGLSAIRTFREFDERFTAPFHNFRSVDEYWDTCSSRNYVASISIPTLIVNALDDPFLSPSCFPHHIAERHPTVSLETPEHGGHVGFISSLNLSRTWIESRAVSFLESHSPKQ